MLGELFAGIPKAPVPLVLAPDAQPYLTGTALHPGSAFPKLVLGEVDEYVRNGFQPAGVTVLAASLVSCTDDLCQHGHATGNATLYTAPSGAMVFDAGTFGGTGGWTTTPGWRWRRIIM